MKLNEFGIPVNPNKTQVAIRHSMARQAQAAGLEARIPGASIYKSPLTDEQLRECAEMQLDAVAWRKLWGELRSWQRPQQGIEANG